MPQWFYTGSLLMCVGVNLTFSLPHWSVKVIGVQNTLTLSSVDVFWDITTFPVFFSLVFIYIICDTFRLHSSCYIEFIIILRHSWSPIASPPLLGNQYTLYVAVDLHLLSESQPYSVSVSHSSYCQYTVFCRWPTSCKFLLCLVIKRSATMFYLHGWFEHMQSCY